MNIWKHRKLDEIMALLDHAMISQMREIDEIRHKSDDAYFRYLPEIEKINSLNKELEPQFRNIESSTFPLRELVAKYSANEVFNLPAYSAIKDHLEKMSSTTFNQSLFVTSLVYELNSAFSIQDQTQSALLLKKLLAYFLDKINSLSPSHLNYKGIKQNLLVIIHLLLILFGIIQNDQSTKHSDANFRQLFAFHKEIITKLEKINTPERSDKIFFALSNVNVRTQPTKSSAKICQLYPNQEVEIINRRDNWYYIEFFDYIEAIPKTGYVYYKLLQPKIESKK